MKKILFSAYDLGLGGIETSLVTLLNTLIDKYDITLVLEKKQGIFFNRLDKRIKTIEYTPNACKIAIVRKINNLVKRINFSIKYKNKFDFSCAYATYSIPSTITARIASKNSVLWVHSEYKMVFKGNMDQYIDFYTKIKAYKFKKVVFVSNNAKSIFIDVFKNDINYKDIDNKLELIHNLIDYTGIIEKSQVPVTDAKKEDIYTFVNVGRHTEEDKKITRIIESAKRLKEDNKNFRVLLIGDGSQTENYKKMIKEEKLEKTIILLGRKENPYPYYKIADSFLLTSEYEGFPVIYIEAMILGLPIITTEVSDSRELIDNKYGIVVDRNTEAVYNAMKNAIEKGLPCKEKFDYKQYNEEILKQIDKIINKN